MRYWKYDVATLVALALFAALCCASCSVSYPVSAAGPLNGERTGTSTNVQLLGITVKDGGTVREAARAGGLTTVQTVDVRETAILRPVYVKRSTIVTGE